ncbi:hypothetical protein [Pontibacter sp. G13]|uniref:hypothetical protein n=1 Tax=Pontibacter sp. G13 TaxID=3074898 RepID=UPI00288AE9C0|nr:hypothetical protein [Pontibacter sp. G13]WNJ18379.1 hypothetical protein RJD25_26290 [Pontibacter sp. G13]
MNIQFGIQLVAIVLFGQVAFVSAQNQKNFEAINSVNFSLSKGHSESWKVFNSPTANRLSKIQAESVRPIVLSGDGLFTSMITYWTTFDLEQEMGFQRLTSGEQRTFLDGNHHRIQYDSCLHLYHWKPWEDWNLEIEWQELTEYEVAARESELKHALRLYSGRDREIDAMIQRHDPMILARVAERACLLRHGHTWNTIGISEEWSPYDENSPLYTSCFVFIEALTHLRMQTWGLEYPTDSTVWSLNPSHFYNRQEILTAMIFFRRNAHHFVWNDSLEIFEWDELPVKPSSPVRSSISQLYDYQNLDDPFEGLNDEHVSFPGLRNVSQMPMDVALPIAQEYEQMKMSRGNLPSKLEPFLQWGNDLRNAGFIFSEQTLSHPALIELQTHPKSYIPQEVVAEIPGMSWEEIQIMSLEGWLRRFDSWQKEPFEEELDAWYWNYLWESCAAAIEFETPHRPIRGGHRYPVELMPHQPRIVHSGYKWLIPPPYLPIAQLGVF